jgi:hypothetical protein
VVTQRDPLIDTLADVLDLARCDPDLCNTPPGSLRARLAEAVLDALPALLLADSRAGDQLRTRLGLRLDRTLANLGPNGVAMYGGPVNDRTRLVALHSGWFEVSDE